MAGGNAAYKNAYVDFAHIQDPNERRRLALAEIDKAPFGWYHVRAVVVAGVGFFTDSYDIFAVSLLTTMIGYVYSNKTKGVLPTPSDTAIKVATSAGTVVGQFGFGALADIVGRKRMYGLELIVIIVATLAQALTGPGPGTDIIGLLIFWRVIMGIGIGGDYPLSSIITSEFATTKWRGAMMGAVFAMQGFGQMTGALVMLFLTLGFKESLLTAKSAATCTGVCALAVDKMWRALIGFGAVPACIALYYRLTIPETPRYTFDVARDTEKAKDDVEAYIAGKHEGIPDTVAQATALRESEQSMAIPKASFRDFIAYYGQWKNGKVLFGTAGSWFLLDVAFYGLSLNTATVLTAIGYGTGPHVYQILYNVAAGNCILICAGAIPGYWMTVATVDTIGRKPIQLGGFIILTILFIVWGFDYKHMKPHAHLAMYVLVQFFFQFGPNATTFIVPGECFPTRYRSTSHGFSAGMGKIGSIIAQAGIAPLRTRGASAKAGASPWQNHVMQIYALFMFLGIFTTLCIPETKRKTLEQLSGEEPSLHGEGEHDHHHDVSREVVEGKASPVGTEEAAVDA
ncbi:inorganic phosphate transporter 1-6 /Pi cotransporter [Mollisia scopiformis]|uniref:Inorganic phosphate transporter 1-6 /Pi cotransporter n=1 Tax=Mollisia scopiformis TaxID=149040 RepID=A0A194X2T8_MOLSC|nr:inorganic phosphate transporter 1-6 /Pi cotransporter [Mollisia scopiformis]KUJ14493.1 inorganic phosphate transporter 1-6 /Pi cotransporter [Mollisia scopiformis]